MKNYPKLYGTIDAAQFLGISRARFYEFLKQNRIPFQKTSAGKIFFEDDLISFQKSREEKMKHARKPHQV